MQQKTARLTGARLRAFRGSSSTALTALAKRSGVPYMRLYRLGNAELTTLTPEEEAAALEAMRALEGEGGSSADPDAEAKRANREAIRLLFPKGKETRGR